MRDAVSLIVLPDHALGHCRNVVERLVAVLVGSIALPVAQVVYTAAVRALLDHILLAMYLGHNPQALLLTLGAQPITCRGSMQLLIGGQAPQMIAHLHYHKPTHPMNTHLTPITYT